MISPFSAQGQRSAARLECTLGTCCVLQSHPPDRLVGSHACCLVGWLSHSQGCITLWYVAGISLLPCACSGLYAAVWNTAVGACCCVYCRHCRSRVCRCEDCIWQSRSLLVCFCVCGVLVRMCVQDRRDLWLYRTHKKMLWMAVWQAATNF
jgi:hypothetical protein